MILTGIHEQSRPKRSFHRPRELITIPLVDESLKSQTLNAYRELVKLGEFADNSLRHPA